MPSCTDAGSQRWVSGTTVRFYVVGLFGFGSRLSSCLQPVLCFTTFGDPCLVRVARKTPEEILASCTTGAVVATWLCGVLEENFVQSIDVGG